MKGYSPKFRIFAESELREELDRSRRGINTAVEGEKEDYILNVNEEEYISHLVDAYTRACPTIDFQSRTVTQTEVDVSTEQLNRGWDVYWRGGVVHRRAYVFHLPFSGDESLLRCAPGSRLLWTLEVFLQDGEICFQVIDYNERVEDVKQSADEVTNNLSRQLRNVATEVEAYNNSLRRNVEEAFRARKAHILKSREMLASLGVPVKERANLSSTYSVPAPQFRASVLPKEKPTVKAEEFRPEPTLDESVYRTILQTIHDLGRVFERLPSTYSGKSEEDLRDHILLYLEPRFEGAATGETFNKTGKTDILLRHENSNVFIAECKFWRGRESFLKTISQLLGYLTWRDSKAAVIVFVRNKDISTVIQSIGDATPLHPNYLGFRGQPDDSWLDYRLHINGDPNREVKLAVLAFHFPDVAG